MHALSGEEEMNNQSEPAQAPVFHSSILALIHSNSLIEYHID
jgi:hypothetical protein